MFVSGDCDCMKAKRQIIIGALKERWNCRRLVSTFYAVNRQLDRHQLSQSSLALDSAVGDKHRL